MAAYQTAVLVVQSGRSVGQEFALDKDTVTIGRALDNDVILDDEQISRHHANIRRQGNQFVLTDLASANGTFVNRARIAEPHALRPGEMIQMGSMVLEFRQSTAAAATVIGVPSEQTAIGRPPAPAAPPPRYPPPQPAYVAPPPQPAYVPPPVPAPAVKKKGRGAGGWCGCLVVLLIIVVCLIVLAVFGYLFAVMFALLPDTFGVLPMLGLQPGSLF